MASERVGNFIFKGRTGRATFMFLVCRRKGLITFRRPKSTEWAPEVTGRASKMEGAEKASEVAGKPAGMRGWNSFKTLLYQFFWRPFQYELPGSL